MFRLNKEFGEQRARFTIAGDISVECMNPSRGQWNPVRSPKTFWVHRSRCLRVGGSSSVISSEAGLPPPRDSTTSNEFEALFNGNGREGIGTCGN